MTLSGNYQNHTSHLIAVAAAFCLTAHATDFEKDILPVFQTHCHDCHGVETQKSGLRLDLRSAAFRGGNDGAAIVPGDAGNSQLFDYISLPRDHEKAMPPKGPGLSKQQIAAVKKWIDEGANWPDHLAGDDSRLDHWAWQPLRNIKPPEGVHPIDAFIEAKLRSINYIPPVHRVQSNNVQSTLSPQADRRTLIRRLAFDLHGMPPAPEMVETFVADSQPDAYRRLIDQLLDSPHFGERLARHWLDIAHYADTHGFERDKRRDTAWRYRDYVIESFNADKPYDRFLKEQIAGDVLYPGNDAATIATGFLAAGPWDFVGQVETKSPVLKRAARALDLDDMTTQVLTATMGLTVNCARCHDHKLDPITQEEYYQLTAVFAGSKRGERDVSATARTQYDKKKTELNRQRNRIAHQIGQLEGTGIDLADVVGAGNGRGSGVAGQGIDPRNAVVQTREFGPLGNVKTNRFAASKFDYIDGVFIADGENGKAKIPINSAGMTVSGIPSTSGKAWDHIRNGPVASQYSTELGGIDFAKDGNTILGIHANAGISFDLEAIRKDTGDSTLKFSSQVGYFGAPGGPRADVWIFVDDSKAAHFQRLTREEGLQSVDITLPKTARFLTLLVTDGENGYGHDQVGFGNAKISPAKPRSLNEKNRQMLSLLKKQAATVEKQLQQIGDPPKFYGVVADEEVPEIRIQRRGNPESPTGEPLAPGAVALLDMLDPELAPIDATDAERRRALAQWIAHPDNPLTARVIANRVWYWLFGQGIVSTPSDFGLGGGEPSHPRLLDWLAGELVHNGWSLKSLYQKILLSETYRQTSTYTDDHPGVTVDAGNRYLWRQNPRRIEAEAIRDSVLFVSGKLNETQGGPGFRDFTYKEAYAPEYTYITADSPDLWRRSIYRFIVRTTPDRFLTTLDCPDPANLTPKRLTTTTPLQSLALFNNEFMLRQAQYLARRIERESGSEPEDQINRAFVLTLSRKPSEAEMQAALSFLKKEDLFAFCRSLLNTNEFVYVD